MKTNLYIETVKVLEKNGKAIKDIVWVGTREATIDKEQFLEEVKQTEYDNGYGGAEIALDLIIVGVDWWLSRGEYDGAEWWVFNTLPQRSKRERVKFDISSDHLFKSDYRG